MMNKQITCRVLTGPTASGKTELGIRLARENGWHVLCMDSMQIFRRMDIGTAKPTPEEREGVPHHLIDICEPTDSFSVCEYRERAEKLIRDLHDREGKEVLLIGGTAFYLQALMYPLAMGQADPDPRLREALNRMAETPEGRQKLHSRLSSVDPATAERLPQNDMRRIIRAIEVYEATGVPFSAQPSRKPEDKCPFRWKVVSTSMDRNVLYDRINRRVTEMIRRGLRDEVASLLEEGVPEDAQSMSGLGYKEMIPCIRGDYSLEDAAEKIRTGTRHYAKRQMTFLRREKQIRYVRTDRDDAYEAVRDLLMTEDENNEQD